MFKRINPLSRCLVLLRRAAIVVLAISSISVVTCSGHQKSSDRDEAIIERGYRKPYQSWSSNVEKFLILNKVGIEIGEEEIHTREELVMRLQREFRSMIYFPTALSNGVNVGQKCIEDSLFYAESLFIRRAEWALKSITTLP